MPKIIVRLELEGRWIEQGQGRREQLALIKAGTSLEIFHSGREKGDMLLKSACHTFYGLKSSFGTSWGGQPPKVHSRSFCSIVPLTVLSWKKYEIICCFRTDTSCG